MERLRWPLRIDYGLIFTNTPGGRVDASNIRESRGRRLKNANLPALRTRDRRRTAATTHLRNIRHPNVVQELLGRSTIAVTINTYNHVMPTIIREAADRMDALFRCDQTAQ